MRDTENVHADGQFARIRHQKTRLSVSKTVLWQSILDYSVIDWTLAGLKGPADEHADHLFPDYEMLLEMLREARERRGFTQDEMAKRLATTQSAVSKCERGELRMDIIQVRDWCRALGISFARFASQFDRRASAPVKR